MNHHRKHLFSDEWRHNSRTPPYFVLNLHKSCRIIKNLQLLADIDNSVVRHIRRMGRECGVCGGAPDWQDLACTLRYNITKISEIVR
jgi:hypothetical protein